MSCAHACWVATRLWGAEVGCGGGAPCQNTCRLHRTRLFLTSVSVRFAAFSHAGVLGLRIHAECHQAIVWPRPSLYVCGRWPSAGGDRICPCALHHCHSNAPDDPKARK
jgi:hypothetical protein